MRAQQLAGAELAHVPGQAAGQGAAHGLDVAHPGPGTRLPDRPGQRRQLPVQAEDGDRSRQGKRRRRPLARPGALLFLLHRQDRVLEARVVELHDVGAGRALARQSLREVGVHDVEAAGAQLQVPGLHVDHHVVARLGR